MALNYITVVLDLADGSGTGLASAQALLKAEAQLQAAITQLAALNALALRASRKVGECPNCHGQITGYDLLGTGQCQSCIQTLSGLIAPERTAPTLDQLELLVLVGSLGLCSLLLISLPSEEQGS